MYDAGFYWFPGNTPIGPFGLISSTYPEYKWIPINATNLTRDISVLPSVSIAALPASKSIAPATPPSGEPRDSYHVHVNGLACPFCVYGLESSIGAISGVDSVAVDLKTGLVRISVGDGVILDEALVRETILDAGFTVEAIEPTTQHDLQQIRN